jgi:hypothetical protein
VKMKADNLLEKIFPPFRDLAREKPRDMLFIADDQPDILLVLLGLTLVKGGAVGFTGCKDGMIDWASFVVAGAALKTVVIFSVWTLKRPGCLRWLSTLRPGSRWPPLWAYSVPNR